MLPSCLPRSGPRLWWGMSRVWSMLGTEVTNPPMKKTSKTSCWMYAAGNFCVGMPPAWITNDTWPQEANPLVQTLWGDSVWPHVSRHWSTLMVLAHKHCLKLYFINVQKPQERWVGTTIAAYTLHQSPWNDKNHSSKGILNFPEIFVSEIKQNLSRTSLIKTFFIFFKDLLECLFFSNAVFRLKCHVYFINRTWSLSFFRLLFNYDFWVRHAMAPNRSFSFLCEENETFSSIFLISQNSIKVIETSLQEHVSLNIDYHCGMSERYFENSLWERAEFNSSQIPKTHLLSLLITYHSHCGYATNFRSWSQIGQTTSEKIRVAILPVCRQCVLKITSRSSDLV